MSDIYNKNAREKALLEEAYTNVYNEVAPIIAAAGRALAPAAKKIGAAAVTGAAAGAHDKARGMVAGDEEGNYSANDLRLQQIQIGSQVMWDGMMKRGQVEEVDLENGVAVVYDEDGGDHIVPLGDFDVILPVEDAEGALGNLVKGVGRGIGDVAKGAGRVGAAVGGAGAVVAGGALGAAMNIARTLTADQLKKLGEYALEISADAEDGEFKVDLPDGTNLQFDYDEGKTKRLGSSRPARSAEERRLATAEGGYMVGRGDPRIKRPERTQFAISGDEEEPGPSEVQQMENHAKGVKMALEALEMFKDELHVDGHPEDVNVNELADAHDQLSRALHWLLDETDVEYIIGGRATQRSEAQSQKEDHGGHDDESWHELMSDYEEHGN